MRHLIYGVFFPLAFAASVCKAAPETTEAPIIIAQFGSGCIVPGTGRTVPHEARYCEKENGKYVFKICKPGGWKVFATDMEPDDERCHLSCIPLHPINWAHPAVDRKGCAP